MVENGYIAGRTGNVFAPAGRLSRAEAVKMIDNVIRDFVNNPGTYSDIIDGNLVINTSDVVLKSMTVKGNLYLTQGIGSGNVTLQNVTVTGMTVIQGGQEIKLDGNFEDVSIEVPGIDISLWKMGC